ncbi:MAG: LOG family protein [Chloroflexota bacterium]|nr:LOG family protein [Chloroflexota bacterium]
MTMQVSVFGGSSPKPNSEAYQKAYQLGRLLGSAGLTVLTGGYMGTMEAVSRGASEAGGHVIGVTSDAIEAYRPIGPNQWVAEEWRCKTLRQRLNKLIDHCDAAFALPGGVGTLLEICLTWNELVIDAIDPKPLILIGDGWKTLMETFFKELGGYVAMESREYISFAPNPESALTLLKSFKDLN